MPITIASSIAAESLAAYGHTFAFFPQTVNLIHTYSQTRIVAMGVIDAAGNLNFTEYAMICLPQSRQVAYCHGLPCRETFQFLSVE